MSQRSNCFKVHPDHEPGPCCNCGQEDISKRYVHLIHKKSENPGFCNFIKENYKISDLSCICRKCELKFKRIFAGTSEDIQGPSLSKKTCTIEKNISNEKASCFLHQFSKCDKTADHTTTVDTGIFQKVFDINLEHLQDTLQVSLCHIHYNTLSNWKREQVCIVCEKISRTKRFICISDCTNDLFLQYLKQELNFEAELNISEKMFTIASFDNLDKNQSYSVVGSGKDKSGFHGTTIQTATPCPSLPTTVDISVNIDSFSDEMVVDSSRDRSIPINIITAITNPNDNIGLPSSIAENRFSHLTLLDFDCSSNESKSYVKFKEDMNRYGFSKFYLQEKHISVPGVKTFFSLPTQDTEKSSFTSIAVLDETADKRKLFYNTGDRLILHHIFTDTDATAEQTDSLMRYRQFGQEDLANYLQQVAFDNEFKDKALCSKHGSITEYFDTAGDHERQTPGVWLHAVTSSAINIIILQS
ncbi:unnamed protein product [Mytilus coruscus]|uniref:Uncharacterized protein n=1 Tax=Mytilus coruscus TaxID=42192 RepID=A0A6J8E7B2_MYTCO|nr:unnamed protein product [Mytilus coruscus]